MSWQVEELVGNGQPEATAFHTFVDGKKCTALMYGGLRYESCCPHHFNCTGISDELWEWDILGRCWEEIQYSKPIRPLHQFP